MTTRIHANNFSTTLNGSITNVATTLVVTSATGFPSVGGGVTANISVQNGTTIEIMTVTATSGTTFTVTRGAEGTSASAFASLSTVELRVTADSIDRKLDTNGGASSGKVLVSNGTAWVPSTPTFPNASATTRKIIVSDGTNWNASTETYATPSTSGNVLTSDGTNWTSAPPSGGGGGGDLTKIHAITASGTSIVFSSTYITSTYDHYLFVLSDLEGTTQCLGMEVSYANGSPWKTSAGGYNQSIIHMSSDATTVFGIATPNSDEFDLTGQLTSNATTSPISGEVNIHKPTATKMLVDWKLTGEKTGGYARTINGSGFFYDGSTPPINAVRFYYGTDGGTGGTFSGGTITLYGYSK